MPENERSLKNKRVVSNIVYSFLVFFASSAITLVIFDSSALNGSGDKPEVSSRGFLAVGISIVLTIVFSMWFAKRKSRR